MKSGLPIDVEALLDQQRVEGPRIEYKVDWNHECGGSALRTICAFANDLGNINGGYVVFGVEEDNGLPVLPPRGLDPARLDRIRTELQGAINQIHPTYSPLIVPEQVGDVWLMVVVCPGGDARPYDVPESRAKGAQRRIYVRTSSETREAKGDLLRQLTEISSRLPFDDRACYEASIDDISPALVQHHLHQDGSKLVIGRTDGTAVFRKMSLLKRINGHEVPRNVALLFFNDNPRQWFGGASIEVAQYPDGKAGDKIIERTFEGPVPMMLRSALDYLRGLIPTEIRKHADRAEADRVEAWPFGAVEEALVNAVHHRGYDVADPIKVDILPDRLRIMSYPGPVPGLTLDALSSDDAPPVQGRNRRIAELLRQLDMAEARGTGLPKIRAEMSRNGSPEPRFRFDEDRTWFEVLLPIHPAFTAQNKSAPPAQPLRIGRPAPPNEVVGRDELVARLLRVLENQSVLLLGPEGRGVSSVMGVVAERLREKRVVIEVDLEDATLEGLVGVLLAWEDDEDPRPNPDLIEAQLAVSRELKTKAITAIEALVQAVRLIGPSKLALVAQHLDRAGKYDDHRDRFWTQEALQQALLSMVLAMPDVRAVLGLTATADLVVEHRSRWLKTARPFVVPPLSLDHTTDLALRLLRGVQLPAQLETAKALAASSAGLPGFLTCLVARLHETLASSPAGVEAALIELAGEPGDPSGLLTRASDLLGLTMASTETGLLDLVSAVDDGLRKNDLIARSVTARLTPTDIAAALRNLDLDGWLVEVDGVLRFEHPWIRDAWRSRQQRPPNPYFDQDIP